MIRTIARHAFLDNLMTLRFAFVTAFSVVLVILGTLIQVSDLEKRLEDYDAGGARVQEASARAKIFFDVRLGVGRRPPALAFLCAGQDRSMPHFSEMGVLSPPFGALGIPVYSGVYALSAATGYSRRLSVHLPGENPLMAGLQAVDFAFVVSTFLSLLALLLSFDGITGEREEGTLPLVLSHPVSKAAVLLGKAVGGIACLAVAITVSLAAALVVGLQSPGIALSATDWLGVGLLFLAGLVFLAGLFVLGLLVSAAVRRSATALIVLLLIWTAAVVLIPNGSPFVASLASPTTPDRQYLSQDAAGGKAASDRLMALGRKFPKPDAIEFRYLQGVSRFSGSVPYARSIDYAPREAVAWYLTGTEAGNEIMIEGLHRSWQTYQARFRELLAQRNLAEWTARLSPAFAFTNLAERIAGTHAATGAQFAQQAKRFYDRFLDYARAEDGLGRRFFTPLEMRDLLSLAQYRGILEAEGARAGNKKLEILYREKIDRAEPIRGLPVFRFNPPPVFAFLLQTDLALLMLLPALWPSEQIDWAFAAGVILSLVALVLTFDAVSGERIDGTLRQVLSHPVRRHTVILAKMLGAYLPVMAVWTLGVALYLLVWRTLGGASPQRGRLDVRSRRSDPGGRLRRPLRGRRDLHLYPLPQPWGMRHGRGPAVGFLGPGSPRREQAPGHPALQSSGRKDGGATGRGTEAAHP